MIRVSVLVSVYNRLDLLRKALLSIANQSAAVHEVVLADDGSAGDLPGELGPFVQRLGLRAVWVGQADLGFRLARCRNNGIRVASGEYVISTDQDIVFTRDYVRRHLDLARPGQFLVSYPARLAREPSERVTDAMIRAGAFQQVLTPVEVARIRAQQRKDRLYRWLHRLGLRPIGPKLRGGAFGAFREDLVRVNGFDERYQGWGNEDDDLGWRLHCAGVGGRNGFGDQFPVHLWHPTHSGGERPNLAYYRRRQVEIRRGDFRCEHGLGSPLGDDAPVARELR